MMTLNGRPYRFSRHVDLMEAVGAAITAYWGVSAHNVPAVAALDAETAIEAQQRGDLSMLFGRAALGLELLLNAAADDELPFVLVDEATLERVSVQREIIGAALRVLRDDAIRPWLDCPANTPTPDAEAAESLMQRVFAELVGNLAAREHGGWRIEVERDALLELLSEAPNPDDSPSPAVFWPASAGDANADAHATGTVGTWTDVCTRCFAEVKGGRAPETGWILEIIETVSPRTRSGDNYASKTIDGYAGRLREALLRDPSDVLTFGDSPGRWPRVNHKPESNARGHE